MFFPIQVLLVPWAPGANTQDPRDATEDPDPGDLQALNLRNASLRLHLSEGVDRV